MKRIAFGVTSVIFLLFFIGTADAGLILDETDILSGTATSPSNPKEADIVAYLHSVSTATYGGLTDVGVLLFKWEQGKGEDKGTLLDSYNVINQIDSGRGGVTLQHVPQGEIVSSPAWLVVKGGNTGFVVYDLGPSVSNWNGTMDLSFENFGLFKKNDGTTLQGISNFQIWGGSPPSTPPSGPPNGPPNATVPEPTSAAVWSLGVLAVGLITNRRKRNA